MKRILIVLLLVFTSPVFGQNHFLGLKSGINWTNVNSSLNFNTNKRTTANIGITYLYRVNKNFHLGTDLLLYPKGFTTSVEFTDENGYPLDYNKVYFKYNYLTLPLKAGYSIGNKIAGFVNFGIVPSYLISAEHTFPSLDNNPDGETIDVTDLVNKFDFAGMIELGGSYKTNDWLNIFVSLNYQHSFTSITNNEYLADSEVKNFGISLSFGIWFALQKKTDHNNGEHP